MSITYLLATVIGFYTWLIIAYVLMSWFPLGGVFAEIYQALATIVDPYLNLFRRIIPPMGMLDISPIVAILVLQAVQGLIYRL